VSVIIPARDAGGTIGATLAGLERQDFDGEFEVIVVDDQSTDDTAEIAERSLCVRAVLRTPGVGPGRARNAGAAAARGELLAFLDADCQPSPAWLAAGAAALGSADLVQGFVRPHPSERIGAFDRTLWITRPTGLYESANLFVRRSLFERLGGFESWLQPREGKELGEDVWFGWRARRAGARTGFCDEALAYHAVFPRRASGLFAEQRRRRYFPALARRIPELRGEVFYRRYFLSGRSAAFDAALLGTVLAVARRSPLALLAAAPYARLVARDALPHGGLGAPRVAVARVAADLVGGWALLRGSLASRTLVL
jgi:glycosyltransferase involved in cell wall biosynthesis